MSTAPQVHHHLATAIKGVTCLLKQLFGGILNLPLPLTYLYQMDAMLLGNLIDGLHSTQGLQPQLRFELRQLNSSLSCLGYDLPLTQGKFPT